MPILKKQKIKRTSIYFGQASLYLPNFNVFVWRLPSGTLANSQVDKCLNA